MTLETGKAWNEAEEVGRGEAIKGSVDLAKERGLKELSAESNVSHILEA